MKSEIDAKAIIHNATLSFQISKRYLRGRDIKLFMRYISLNQSDIDFIEQIILIHLKNIEKQSLIAQNFIGTLDDFIFNNLFTQHFFSTTEMLRLIGYRFSILPSSSLLKAVKRTLNPILSDNLKKMKFFKKTHNIIYFLQPLPTSTQEIESFIQVSINIFLQQKIDGIMLNPMQIVLNSNKDSKIFMQEFYLNLKILADNLNAKILILDNTHEFFYEILECVKRCIDEIAYPISLVISLPSYHLESLKMLEQVKLVSAKLVEKKKPRIIIRIKDVDCNYEYQEFLVNNSHKMNINFSNHTSAMTNFIALLQQCKQYAESLEFIVATNNFLMLELLEQFELPFKLEVDPHLSFAFYKLALKKGFSIITRQYYTQDFTQVLARRMKEAFIDVKYGLFENLNMYNNPQEWKKKCESFLKSVQNIQRNLLNDILQSKHLQHYNFETFDYELQRPLYIPLTTDSTDHTTLNENSYHSQIQNALENNAQSFQSFAHCIKESQEIMPDIERLEDVLYLNAQDLQRITTQGANTPLNTFSLNTEREKELLHTAIKKQEDIFTNHLDIMISIIAQLKSNSHALFATLRELYPHIPIHIVEEQIYLLIDTFKYYAYEYRQLFNEADSVVLMPLGNIFIHTKNLELYEIGALIACNIMIGNVSLLEDCAFVRILYHIFKPVFALCPFMGIVSKQNVLDKGLIDYEIVSKDELINHATQANLFVWHRGICVVFISSFYDFYDAYLQIQDMQLFGNLKILIYTDSYIFKKAKQVFATLEVKESSLGNLINNLPKDSANISLFTYNKTEVNYVINHARISISLNSIYKPRIILGSSRAFYPGYLPPFGSKMLLFELLQTTPNNVIKNNSLYSDIIGCFNFILSVDETDFLYNLNHNYSQFLKNLERVHVIDNIYALKQQYDMCLRVYEHDDLFHVCVIMLIAFLLQIPTRISFTQNYFEIKENILAKLAKELQEQSIDNFTLVMEGEEEFLQNISETTLLRILQDENDFSTTNTYKALRKRNILAQYSLPILDRNLELERYLSTQYIWIEPNFFLQNNIKN